MKNRRHYTKNSRIVSKVRETFYNINLRCDYPGTHGYEYYGGRGIKNLLTIENLQFLWERDGADKMQQPSIDRKNTAQNYTLGNCRFIEMKTNRQQTIHKKNSTIKIDQALDALIRKGLKKPEILFRLDCTSATLWNWRTRKVTPHPDNLLKLEALLAEKGLSPRLFR